MMGDDGDRGDRDRGMSGKILYGNEIVIAVF